MCGGECLPCEVSDWCCCLRFRHFFPLESVATQYVWTVAAGCWRCASQYHVPPTHRHNHDVRQAAGEGRRPAQRGARCLVPACVLRAAALPPWIFFLPLGTNKAKGKQKNWYVLHYTTDDDGGVHISSLAANGCPNMCRYQSIHQEVLAYTTGPTHQAKRGLSAATPKKPKHSPT